MFKISTLLLLIWCSTRAFAQIKPDSSASFKERMDWIVEPLPKSYLTTGILLDRSFPVSGIGSNNSDSIPDTTSGVHWIQAFHEIQEARLQPESQSPHKDMIRESRMKNDAGFIPTALLRMIVNQIDTSLLGDSSLQLNAMGQLVISNGRILNPFISSNLHLGAALTVQNLVVGKEYRLEFPRIFSNHERGQYLQYFRFRKSGQAWQTIQPGSSLPIVFQNAGSSFLEIEAKWEDGHVVNSVSSVSANDDCDATEEAEKPDDCAYWANNPKYQASCGNLGYKIEAAIPYKGVLGKAEVYYYRRTNSASCDFGAEPLLNPVILVDGIDFEDKRKGQAIYGKYLQIAESINYPNGLDHFGKKLRDDNRDLLILNFPNATPENVIAGKANPGIDGGCDYIERNAMTLVRLIQMTKQSMQDPNQKITIIGPSMGGLIARYALAYMEKHEAETGTHNCKLFISQDAPHLGANIPIGTQLVIKSLAIDFGVATANDFLKSRLGNPASKELLLNHCDGTSFGPNSMRAEFLANQLANAPDGKLGWPVHSGLTKIALHNGSLNGLGNIANDDPIQSVVPGAVSFSMSAGLRRWAGLHFLLAGLPIPRGLARISAGWEARFAPANGLNGDVFQSYFRIQTPISDSRHKIIRQKVNSLNQGVSIDASPGGIYDAPDQLYTEISKYLNGQGSSVWNLILAPNIGEHQKFGCFIPVKSALGFHWNTDRLSTDLGEKLNNRNLVCTGEIPFHDYYQPSSSVDVNTPHIQLLKGQVDFILKHLNPVAPPQINYTANLIGPKGVQSGSKTDYTVQYQGDFDFITNWQIVEISGITATITNPNSETCQVQVGNGISGSQDGYFILKAVTMVRTINGEIICAGESQRKVFVRTLPSIGNIEQLCNLVSKNYSINFKSVKPPAAMQSNGVMFNRAEWQISEFNNTDFGPDAWQYGSNWSFHVSPNTEYNMGPPSNITYLRSMVFFQGGLSPSAGGTFYIRSRGIFTMVNPDNNLETIEFSSAWKYKAADFTITANPVSCPSHIVVSPNPAIKGTDHTISFVTPGSISIPATGEILDQRGNTVLRFDVPDRLQTISVDQLDLAEYTLKLSSGTSVEEARFVVAKTATDRMVISPNPLFKGIDETALVRIFGSATTDERFNVILTDEQGQVAQNIWVEGREFSLDVTDLEIGSYVVTVTGENTLFEEVLELGMKGQPYVQVNPNPVVDLLNAEIINPIDPDDSYTIIVADKLGLNVLETTTTGSTFQLDLSGLPPDLYYIKMTGRGLTLSKLFRKE